MNFVKCVVGPWRRALLLMAPMIAFVLATTYPYTFGVNHAALLDGVATFEHSGLLTWNKDVLPPKIESVAIHLILRSYSNAQTGPARIVTYSRDHLHSNFTIGQENTDLIIRLRREASDALGMPPFVIPKVFESAQAKAIDVSIAVDNLTVKISGKTVLAAPLVSNPFELWDPSYTLAVGNELTWERPWLGEIQAFQLDTGLNKANMLRDTAISRPGFFHQLHRRLQLYSTRSKDIVLNLFLMIPFGAMTSLVFRRHQITRTLLMWLIAATAIEIVQASIPGRFPTISDALLNGLGAGIGAWIVVRFGTADLGNSECLQKRSRA